jgi:hypothetical protein
MTLFDDITLKGLVTIDDLTTRLEYEGESAIKDDDYAASIIKQASIKICRVCRRFWHKEALTLYHSGTGTSILPLKYPIILPSSEQYPVAVAIDYEAGGEYEELEAACYKVQWDRLIRIDEVATVSQYEAENQRAVWPRGTENIEIEATFGAAEVPDDVKEATLLLCLDKVAPERHYRARLRSHGVKNTSMGFESTEQVARLTGNLEVDRILVHHVYSPRRGLRIFALEAPETIELGKVP